MVTSSQCPCGCGEVPCYDISLGISAYFIGASSNNPESPMYIIMLLPLIQLQLHSFRESHELVMMRREELLAKEAWKLDDAAVDRATQLRQHEECIFRLFQQALPSSTCSEEQNGLDRSARARSLPRDHRSSEDRTHPHVKHRPARFLLSFLVFECCFFADGGSR